MRADVHTDLTQRVIGAAIEVHRHTGPGLLESTYEHLLVHELLSRGMHAVHQVELPVVYKSQRVECGYRIDLIVEDACVVEIKAVEKLLPVHEAQLITYLRLSGLPVGLLMNFNVPVLRDGIVRRVLSPLPQPPRA